MAAIAILVATDCVPCIPKTLCFPEQNIVTFTVFAFKILAGYLATLLTLTQIDCKIMARTRLLTFILKTYCLFGARYS